MTGFQHIHIVRTKDNIIWLTIDAQHSTDNALTMGLLKEMREVIDDLQGKGFKGLVISSAKPSNFIAGTELATELKLTSLKKAEIFTTLGNQLCRCIINLDCPSIALINGNCSNGGLDIALSCDYRLTTDNPKTRLCYSDIKRGHYAGFGGITQLIQLKGLTTALEILDKNTYSAEEALAIGLVDHVVPSYKTHQAALYLIAQENEKSTRKLSSRFNLKAFFRTPLPNKVRAMLLGNQYHNNPLNTIIETWKTFDTRPDASHQEAIVAAQLIISNEAKNHLKLQHQYQKLGDNISAIDPLSQRVHIIGCGVMGRYIARCCAANGFYVSIYDTRYSALEKVLPELYQNLQYDTQRRQRVIDRLLIDVDNIGLAHADIIIEAIPENKHAKASLLHEIDQQAKANAYILSTTACLPLEEIAKGMQTPQRLATFNPYHPLFDSKLAEISTFPDNPAFNERIKAFVNALQLKPIQVKSSSGYLGTRLLITYLTESMLIHQSGISILAIDKLTANMGMNHAPFDLIDSIGLSECLKITEALSDRLNYDVPSILMQKNEQGLKGKNAGAGFYRYKKGRKQLPILDKTLSSPSWKNTSKDIEKRLIEKIINEARSCLQQEIVNDQQIIDLVATVITGFATKKGGPLAYLEQLQQGNQQDT